MDKVTKDHMHKFLMDDGELLEVIVDLINGDYTVEDLRKDYKRVVDECVLVSHLRITNTS
jgi:hypothetical protein